MRGTLASMVLGFASWACQSSAAAAPEVPTAAPTGGPTYTVPASIDASGTVDVTDPLMTFFASVPDSATILFPKGATYRVEGTLLFTNRNNLTIDGNGATLIARTDGSSVRPPPPLAHRWPRGRRHIMFVGGSNVVVRRLSVIGANPNAGVEEVAYVAALEAQHAFEFSGVQGGVLDSVRATDPYGDFIYLGPNGTTWSSNITVHDSYFERNGRQGIGITGARDVLIERSYFGHVRRTSIDIEPNTSSGGAQRVTIRHNTFGRTRLNFLSSVGAGGLIEDITIDGNTLLTHALKVTVTAPAQARRSRFRILNNTSDFEFGAPIALITFTRIDGVEVRGNRQPLIASRLMTGVSAIESCSVVVAGNEFLGAIREADIRPASCP